MDILDLKALDKALTRLREIERIIDKLNAAEHAIQVLNQIDPDKVALLTNDCFIRGTAAAKLLGISPAAITTFVKHNLLTPYYVNSNQRRFKLSDVKALAKTKPWRIEEGGVKTNQIVIHELNEKKLTKGGD